MFAQWAKQTQMVPQIWAFSVRAPGVPRMQGVPRQPYRRNARNPLVVPQNELALLS